MNLQNYYGDEKIGDPRNVDLLVIQPPDMSDSSRIWYWFRRH